MSAPIGIRGVRWSLVAALLLAPAGVRAQTPTHEEILRAAREFHQRSSQIIEALEPPPGGVVVCLGATEPGFLAELAEKVGPRGQIVAVYRSLTSYQYARQNPVGRPGGKVEPIFAADGDAHLARGIADLVILLDVHGFFIDEEALFRQARLILRPGGRVAEFRLAKDGVRPGKALPLRTHDEKRAEARRTHAPHLAGLTLVAELPLLRYRTMRLFYLAEPG